jgi:predicted nucleotidyltransferase
MFTVEQRDYVRDRVLEMAKSDPRVTGGALVGSMAGDAEDEWSDIDITFAIAEGTSLEAVLDEWTQVLERELGALHYWDLRSGSSIYRVFLLPSGLEIDVSVTPEQEFGARGPRFRPLFGIARQPEAAPQVAAPPTIEAARFTIGLGWHHVLHARSSIERGKPWRAEYWISGIRDETLSLMCRRLGLEASEARGIDRLPAGVTRPLADALVRSLDEKELRRALAMATSCFISELGQWDPALCEKLKPLLQEFGDSGPTPSASS